MQNPFVFGAGGVLSTDIAVPDHERELKFYSSILTTGETPLWQEDLMNNLGQPVIGLGERVPEYEFLPLQWMPHFQVADVSAAATSAVEKGGKNLMQAEAGDVHGDWAVLVDPFGAGFGVIPAVEGEHDANLSIETIGRISWLSLRVPDLAKGREFYQQVLGWSPKTVDAADSGSTEKIEMWIGDQNAVADIEQSGGDEDNIPPAWLIHLPVGDLSESLKQVSTGGGEIVREPDDSGRAIIRDPVGIYLALQANN